jgi:hypothetical protein
MTMALTSNTSNDGTDTPSATRPTYRYRTTITPNDIQKERNKSAHKVENSNNITTLRTKHHLTMIVGRGGNSSGKRSPRNNGENSKRTKNKQATEESSMAIDVAYSNDKEIDTTSNLQFTDLTEKIVKATNLTAEETKSPFKTVMGEDEDALHDHLSKLTKSVVKVMKQEVILTAPSVNFALQGKLSKVDWITYANLIVDGTGKEVKVLSTPEINHCLITLNRLAHSNPETLFTEQIKKGKIMATNASRAWYTAKTLLGSWYDKPRKVTQTSMETFYDLTNKENQQTPTDSHKKVRMEMPNSPSKGTPLPQTNTHSTPLQTPKKQSVLKVTKAHVDMADVAMSKRNNNIRMMLKIPIPKDKKKSGPEHFIHIMRMVFVEYLVCDHKVALLPWNDEDKKRLPAITSEEQFPDKLPALRPYADRFRRPNPGADVWVKIHIASDRESKEFTSSAGCYCFDIYEEIQGGAYPCTVQDAYDTVEICLLVYTSAFTDTTRLTKEIRTASKRYNNGHEMKLGCRVKMLKELDKKVKDFICAENQMVSVEVDRTQADAAKSFLYREFNDTEKPERTGGYNFRVLPAPGYSTTGTNGDRNYANMVAKHVAVIQSLKLMRCFSIKRLHDGYKIGSNEWTLYDILLRMTVPIIPKAGENSTPMFFSIDYATKGDDAKRNCVYFTAYKDNAPVAEKLLSILPEYLKHEYDYATTQFFCHQTSIDTCPKVEFETNDQGEWTGSWDTYEDKQFEALFEEEVSGHKIDITGIELLKKDEQKRRLKETEGEIVRKADEMSFKSYSSQFAHRRDDDRHKGRAAHAEEEVADDASVITDGSSIVGGTAM